MTKDCWYKWQSEAGAPRHVAVLGAGPAGLTAALRLLESGVRVTILERASAVGGLGGTTVREGRHGRYRFDYGGHRFITRNADLLRLVHDLVGDDLLTAERRSVIRLGGRTYDYPLSIGNLLRSGPPSLLAGAAFDLARMLVGRGKVPGTDFASWTKARFGPTLYRRFFAGYTAKLWGIPPDMLSADWAEQRISLVDIREVARLLMPGKGDNPRTYARRYRYPRLGFGMIFERLAERVTWMGGVVRSGVTVTGFTTVEGPIRAGQIRAGQIEAVLTDQGPLSCDAVVSTIALPDMVRLTDGDCSLSFRGLRFLNMPVETKDISPYTWQYLSDPDILATRLQEPRRRSPEMAPPGHTSLMLEIPCDPGDALWTMADHDLFARVAGDLRRLGIDPGLVVAEEVFSARAAQAYPLMHLGYERERARAIAHLDRYPNLVQCGRQGTFRYIFTDTAMEMGQMAAAALLGRAGGGRTAVYDHRNEKTVIETESIS